LQYGQVASTKCDQDCSGKSAEICGANQTMSVFYAKISKHFNYTKSTKKIEQIAAIQKFKKGSVIENVRIKLENLTEKFNLQDESIKPIEKDMIRFNAGTIA